MASKKKAPSVAAGDVFAARLLDGRYGAIHVVRVRKLRNGRAVFTLTCTQYIGAAPPTMADKALRKVLRTKHSFRNYHSLTATDRPPPGDFVLVGNLPPTRQELALVPSLFGSEWAIVNDVLTEWQWEHEREAMERQRAAWIAEAEAEAAAPKPAPGKRKPTPRSTLTEAAFWKLIGLLGAGKATDDEELEVAPLVTALAKRSQADIREFHQLLAHKLYLLDGKQFADHAGAAGNSGDAFLYARCAVVARGRAFYQSVLAHPDRFPADADGEAMLSVAPDAFTAKTGDDLDDDTHFSYETGSNRDGWPA